MAKMIPSRFTEFEFTAKELFIATRFSELQLMLIQTLVAQAANKKLNLTYDSKDPLLFAQQEAEAQGEMGAYEYLLSLHTDTVAPPAEEEQQVATVAKPGNTTPPKQ